MKRVNHPRYLRMLVLATIAQGYGLSTARAEVVRDAEVTALQITSQSPHAAAAIDYANAVPMALPGGRTRAAADIHADFATAVSTPAAFSPPGSFVTGARGDGQQHPAWLPVGTRPTAEIIPQESGTLEHPFTTVRNNTPKSIITSYPSRASGKLFFNVGSATYVCSASLIKRGVVVTAAHCVVEFGARRYFSNWQFVPAYRKGQAPYGVWTAASAAVLTSYYDGTDACSTPGVVCQSDVALLTLNPKNGDYVGTNTGWYGFGWDGYGFTSGQLAQITQIGYPVCLDNGQIQQRNDSYGYTSGVYQNNTIIGSLMCGGSSGGPWLVNFGARPKLTGTSAGAYPQANIVVGVTSWGYNDTQLKEMGASRFTRGNIKALIDAVCNAAPAACS